MEIYEYIINSFQSFSKYPQSPSKKVAGSASEVYDNRTSKVEEILEKLSEIAFSTKNLLALKRSLKKVMRIELNFFSKEKIVALRDLCDDYFKDEVPEDEEESDRITRI